MSDEYVLRGGQDYLVRQESESPKSWRWHHVHKVQYFTPEDLVDRPGGSSNMARNYVFRRKGWLIAARPDQMFAVPDGEKLRECVRLMIEEDL